jgi:K+-sensing histidine kinase KdpD
MSEPVEREPVQLQSVVEHAIANFTRNHAREIQVSMADDLPPALAEPTYMTQVLTNLISNADKYSPPETPVEVELLSEDGVITVRVKDKGPGVAEAELEQIFDRFYRSPDATTRASGKGLGLTVCKRLVEALSGRIWAENRRDDTGLIVTFTLEAAEVAKPPSEIPAPAS